MTRAWHKADDGNHYGVCEIRIDDESREQATWLRFWRREAQAGRFMPRIQTHCACGMHVELCECERDEVFAYG